MAHDFYRAIALRNDSILKGAEAIESCERQINPESGYSSRELRFVYECICDPDNFKGPFVTTIAESLLDVATEAVRYFTNTRLELIGKDHATGRLVVKSVGQN